MAAKDRECASDLVQSASGGVLLRGVCLDNLSKISACRQTLVELKTNINLKSVQKERHYDLQFFNTREMQDFESKLFNFGIAGAINFSGGMPLGKGNVSLNAFANFERQNKRDGLDSASQESEIILNCTVVSTALWESSLADFKLSASATEDLIFIEKSLSMRKSDLEALCSKFFDKFGTHIFVGNVQFGGVKLTNTINVKEGSSKKFKRNKSDGVKDPMTGKSANVLTALHVETNCDWKNLDSKAKQILTKEESASKYSDEHYIGGPQNYESDAEWKRGLADCPSTWSVINREIKKHNFVPVWKLILQETNSFEDPKRLAEYIEKKIHTESTQIDFVVFEEKNLKTTIDSVHMMLEEDPSEATCLRCINQLLEVIINLDHNAVWMKTLENYDLTSEILLRTTQHVKTPLIVSELKRCLSNILEHSEGVEFQHKFEVLRWLKHQKNSQEKHGHLPDIEIHDIKGLIAWLENEEILKLVHSLADYGIEPDHCLTNIFCKGILFLISKLKQQKYHSDYLLLLAALIPFDFDYGEGSFRTQMTRHKIKEFEKHMKNLLETYEQQAAKSISIQHAWVLKILLSIKERSNTEKRDLIKFLLTNKIELEESVVKNIEDGDLTSIQTELQKLLMDDKGKILSWNLLTKKQFFSDGVSEQPAKSTTSTSDIPQSISKILQAMEFLQFYPEKLTLQKVLELNERTFQKPNCLKEIPLSILRKIISCNSTFREKVLNEFLYKKPKDDFATTEDHYFDSEEESSDHEDMNVENDDLHPLDVFYCIFLCCDPFLKSMLCKKIAEVQLSIPLIYPYDNEKLMFSLWPLRKVFIGDQVNSMARSTFKSICFFKVGNVSFMSKSKLINEIMREQNAAHSTFFNVQCPLGSRQRKAYNGVIEISWYIPSEPNVNAKEKNKDKVEKMLEINEEGNDKKILLLNLRGDINEFPMQAELILLMSNVVVVLVEFSCLKETKTIETMRKFHKSNVKVIMVTNNPPDIEHKEVGKHLKEYGKNANVSKSRTSVLLTSDSNTKRRKNEVSIKQELEKYLQTFLINTDGIILENCAKVVPKFVVVDESKQNCQLGRIEAESIITKIREQANGRLDKTIALPLQGKALWQEWSKQQKRLCNTTKLRSDDEVEHLMTSMLSIRKKQTDKCNSEIITDFVEKILCLDENMEKVMFFLSWLQELLDSESRQVLPNKIGDVLKAFDHLKSGGEEKQIADVILAEKNLSDASFGLEHFFREVGQVYDCFTHCVLMGGYIIEKSTASVIHRLPKAVAKLLLSGRPFEIMDGDAVNIPTNWIKAVFKELETQIGNKRVFSVSVVGVQSTGKSTLLNSMFGLEFPVKSGRCTRGVFLHLIPVTQKIADFDYVFVFDTEGLNSPIYDLGRTNHDNKLATLAIGLADTVIINIMGEAVGENMKNTLEIVIHALMRLKQTNIHIRQRQPCTFVHQNVMKIGKGLELKPDMQRLFQKLDKVTKEVAFQEHLDITSFDDVIKFDVEHDVLHIPNFLQGHPPMAPVSQKYSENVEKVAEHVLRECSKKIRHLTITDTCNILEAVWKGILAEDFVFSFRNCLEIKAYSLLETKFKGLTWEIEKMPHIFWNDKVRQRLHKCTDSEDIESEACSLIFEFTEELNELVNSKKETLREFIQESELNDNMIHWEDGKLNDITETAKKIRNLFENKIKKTAVHFQVRLQNDKMGSEEKIMQKVSDYAKHLKGKNISEEEKRNEFQELWMKSLNELAPNFPISSHARKQNELLTKMKKVLHEEFQSHAPLLSKALGNIDFSKEFWISDLLANVSDIRDECITVRSNWRKMRSVVMDDSKDYKEETFKLTRKIYERASQYLNDLKLQDIECDETHFKHILKIVTNDFQEIDSQDRGFSITHSYRIKVAIRVARYSFTVMSEINKCYEEKHNLYSFLQSKKSQAESVFFDTIQEKADSEIVSNYLCSEIKRQVKSKISRSMSLKVKQRMLENFSFTKSKMIKEIMCELAENENFDKHMHYIKNPEVFVKTWIRQKTRSECFEREGDDFSYFTKQVWKMLSTDVSAVTKFARKTTECSDINTLEHWIQCLCENLSALELDRGCASLLSKYQVRDLKSFCADFTRQISEVETELLTAYKNMNPDDIEWEGNIPCEEIFQFLWGCSEQCPLCLEPCQYTDENHWKKDNIPHRCVQHRPFALGGNFVQGSDKLMIETCNYAIQTQCSRRCGEWCNCPTKNYDNWHLLRDFKTFMPSWDIEPSTDVNGSQYWCWFTAKYSTHLALYFSREPPKIPSHWLGISKESAICSISEKASKRPTLLDSLLLAKLPFGKKIEKSLKH